MRPMFPSIRAAASGLRAALAGWSGLVCLATGAEAQGDEVSVTAGQSVSIELTLDDPIRTVRVGALSPGYFARMRDVSLAVETAGPHRIDVRNTTLGCVLLLDDEGGATVAEGSSIDSFLTPSIQADLEAGRTYRVRVGSVWGETGSFDLVVSSGAPDPPTPLEAWTRDVQAVESEIASAEESGDELALALALRRRGDLELLLEEPSGAKAYLERAIPLCRRIFGEHPRLGVDLAGLARVLVLAGEYHDAVPVAEESLALLDASFGLDNRIALDVSEALAQALEGLFRFDEAGIHRARAASLSELAFGDAIRTAEARLALASNASRRNRHDVPLPESAD